VTSPCIGSYSNDASGGDAVNELTFEKKRRDALGGDAASELTLEKKT